MVKNKELTYTSRRPVQVLLAVAALLTLPTVGLADRSSAPTATFAITSAVWNASQSRLYVSGTAETGATVSVVNAVTLAPLGTDNVGRRNTWRVTSRDPIPVPCSVIAMQSNGQQTPQVSVGNAPADCNGGTGTGGGTPPPVIPDISINSTSQNGKPDPALVLPEQDIVSGTGFQLLSINDLGMHCGDLDTRISSILPPFNVLHAQVIQRGTQPSILTDANGVTVRYSAASNPNDPILTGINSAGSGPVASSMLAGGKVFKTNFWDVALQAYDPFYPQGVLQAVSPDVGLPMPNLEELYLNGGILAADEQEMPGVDWPYVVNDLKNFKTFVADQPFFLNFPFGYVASNLDWFEAAGIPMTAFDDFGRENPWPLYRVEAVNAGGTVVATNDTVVPISGEANCGSCHNDPSDGGNGTATAALGSNVALSIDDPMNDNQASVQSRIPLNVSLEWAADLNLVRLHDLRHNTSLETAFDPATGRAAEPIVCQRCHYTPALDLAQLGPLGPENDGPLVLANFTSPSVANGRDQLKHKSMSNVMHSHHGTVTDNNGNLLFPDMPPPVDANGNKRGGTENPAVLAVLEATCYQCHPGRRTDCLRGAMANGGMVCQDCHGNMRQVGDDFTRNVSPSNPGDFDFVGNFYTDANQPRVPWANEPGCGSCHTGDARSNLADTNGTLVNPTDADGNSDGIRLLSAYRQDDPKATPIVPTNNRFAENIVPASFNGTPNPGAGNPKLYRVSTGHQGVFCEGCHGATHGIWPNKNPNANDNVASTQLQGHTGVIVECSTCHEGDLGNTLGGPHGMHPVGDTRFANGGHESLAKANSDDCRACHGLNGEGTVLSRAATDRTLTWTDDGNTHTVAIAKGEPVTCSLCHSNQL